MLPYNSNNSVEINEILSRPPSIIIRLALGIIFIVLCILITISSIIKYPDIINTQLKFNALNSQKAVFAKVPNRLIKILVSDSSNIKMNQIIGYVECNSNHKDILELENEIIAVNKILLKKNIQYLFNLNLKKYNNIGDIQLQYNQFILDFDEIKKYQTSGYFSELANYTNKELVNIKNIDRNLKEQIRILKSDYEIVKLDFQTQTILFNQGVITKSDLKTMESKMLSKELQLKQLESTFLNNVTRINNLQKEKIENNNNLELKINTLLNSTITLLNSISDWKQKYLLISPMDGYVTFTNVLEEGQLLPQNKEILYVTNGNNLELIGEIFIQQLNFGKIRVGQEVMVKVDAFPYEEYGMLLGSVSNISPISVENKYLIKVKFPSGLRTNFNKNIKYYSGMTASAEIITDNKSLLNRLFMKTYKIFS